MPFTVWWDDVSWESSLTWLLLFPEDRTKLESRNPPSLQRKNGAYAGKETTLFMQHTTIFPVVMDHWKVDTICTLENGMSMSKNNRFPKQFWNNTNPGIHILPRDSRAKDLEVLTVQNYSHFTEVSITLENKTSMRTTIARGRSLKGISN